MSIPRYVSVPEYENDSCDKLYYSQMRVLRHKSRVTLSSVSELDYILGLLRPLIF